MLSLLICILLITFEAVFSLLRIFTSPPSHPQAVVSWRAGAVFHWALDLLPNVQVFVKVNGRND